MNETIKELMQPKLSLNQTIALYKILNEITEEEKVQINNILGSKVTWAEKEKQLIEIATKYE